MSLRIGKNPEETWREVVERAAFQWGLGPECLEIFDLGILNGLPEDQAAWDALYEWDCLDFVEDHE